jgi:LuxR family transcriptional regulator, maltose regulon positive regulatory protein
LSDRKYAYPLILNKVASPRYATPTLRRARLIDWLNNAASGRAAVIAADAGYGKTTLMWQWEREVEFPCYWYKLDRNDRDWTLHISYLAESIAKRHPGFGRRTHSMLEQMGGPGSSRPGVTAYLLAEMHKRLTEPCTFIIDDWHYVNAVTEVRGLWNQILRDAPPTCRFVFASRVKPTLQFARFKTHGGYAELRTDALRFTESEIEELFRDIYRDPLDPAQVAELERRTEGWAASLQLVEVSLRERHTPEDRQSFISSITATKDSDLFDFLAEEVLDQQPEETRNFLLSTSILQQITPEVAERLTGSHDGRRELTALEQRGLFTNRLDEVRYRYHNLFREFLERRLVAERSDSEVVGLHIHAASYFETTEEWPEAIHHYLRAGLQRQAARLIAKYGEDVVSEGRLGLVDEWLQQLPEETIRQNARLSLLFGEATGIRGDWDRALEALERARAYFARKGDRRLEALACLKLSTVYSNLGDPEAASAVARAGLQLVPADSVATRLRLEGNLAITSTWLSGSLVDVSAECIRVAESSARSGLDHFAAIGHHNAGVVLMIMGRYEEAVGHLSSASAFWSDIPSNPFADNSDLVSALLARGDVDLARSVAGDAVRKTAPWPRPLADAYFGLGQVHLVDGRFRDAIDAFEKARANFTALGALHGPLLGRLIEAYFLGGQLEPISRTSLELDSRAPDPRYYEETASARAIAKHVTVACKGECLTLATELQAADAHGAHGTFLIGRVKFSVLSLQHPTRRRVNDAWVAVAQAREAGLWRLLRPWLRLLAAHASTAIASSGGAALVAQLAAFDPDGWRAALAACLHGAVGGDRELLLRAVARTANRETIAALEGIPGSDVADVRRDLRHAQAPRLFLRTLGGLSLHRGDWAGPAVSIDKRRARSLLAVLAAHQSAPLTREMALEILWPDSDPESAVNSLNQTVFQLRRYIDPGYRGGESAEYVLSTSEQVALNADLVYTDIAEIARLPGRLASLDWQHRQVAAMRTVELVRGEFLADLRYEDWVSRQQMIVHERVRERLLSIARGYATSSSVEVAAQAASALLLVDPFDEGALICLAECMSRSGRRAAAQQIVADFARRMASDLDIEPSPQLVDAAKNLGVVKHKLTAPSNR